MSAEDVQETYVLEVIEEMAVDTLNSRATEDVNSNKRKRKNPPTANHPTNSSTATVTLLKKDYKQKVLSVFRRLKECDKLDARELLHASSMDFSVIQPVEKAIE